MRFFYIVLFHLAIPFILLRLFWRGRYTPAYRQRWGERFGFYPNSLASQHEVWIHAVSMGEVQAAIPLIKALLTVPQQTVLVTTMTPTGSQRVQTTFGCQVTHVYLPYDLPWAVTQFLNRFCPRVLILLETELWPNLLYACKQRTIPVILANARLSAPSMANYQRLGSFTRQLLANINLIAAQSETDAARFLSLGVPTEKVHVIGNLKSDFPLPLNLEEQADLLRHQWGRKRPIWIAASTHAGEEEKILDALVQLKTFHPHLLLVLVPRHPERFDAVATLCKQRGYTLVRRSQSTLATPDTEIFLGDTLGELLFFYAAADVAFVGGTLVPIGGHNLLEPAIMGLPIVVGPHTFQCEELCHNLIKEQIAHQIQNSQQLAEVIATYLDNESQRLRTSKRARLFAQREQGALNRLLSLLEKQLDLTGF